MNQIVLPNGETVGYQLTKKNIKNINLRITPDGSVLVSAPFSVRQSRLHSFLQDKASWIQASLEKQTNTVHTPSEPYYTEKELQTLLIRLCETVYPYYQAKGIPYPQIKFRKMTSQWGNCRPTKEILTFNKNLCYAPYECIQYVVWHEWTHFLVPNHSPKFYEELEKVCPDYRHHRNRLKEIHIL